MNILMVKLSAMGDIIHASYVTSVLKAMDKDAHITWVVQPNFVDLVKHNLLVDEIVIFDKKDFNSVPKLIKNYGKLKTSLSKRKYDFSIDLQGLLKSAFVVFASDSKEKIGYCDLKEGSNFISKPIIGKNASGHIIDRYIDTLRALPNFKEIKPYFPWQIFDEEKKAVEDMLLFYGIDLNIPFVVLPVGTNWQNKCWNEENISALAKRLQGKGLEVILIGAGDKDIKRGEKITSSLNDSIINLINKTSIPQMAVLLKYAKLVIGGDTGSVHMAAGFNTKVIMLMGPTDPIRNGPYKQRENVITPNRDCDGCWRRKCPKNLDCLGIISPDMVMKKVEILLG